jgi:hypothetical protein
VAFRSFSAGLFVCGVTLNFFYLWISLCLQMVDFALTFHHTNHHQSVICDGPSSCSSSNEFIPFLDLKDSGGVPTRVPIDPIEPNHVNLQPSNHPVIIPPSAGKSGKQAKVLLVLVARLKYFLCVTMCRCAWCVAQLPLFDVRC